MLSKAVPHNPMSRWRCKKLLGALMAQVIHLNRANATALIKLRYLAKKCVHFRFLLKPGMWLCGEEGLGRDVSRFL